MAMGNASLGVKSSVGKLPLHFDLNLTSSDWPGPKLVGKINPNFVVNAVSIEIVSPFDGSASITIGEDSAQANLVTISDVFLDQIETYNININHKYLLNTDIKIYMTGSPSVGSANIYIYYS